MEEPARLSTPVKIAAAAAAILAVDAAMLVSFGSREWDGLQTLLTAANLAPLAALFWPLLETGGYVMLFGIDYARRAIWEKRQKEIAQAREEGFRLGYEARKAEENGREPSADAGTTRGS